MNRPYTLFTTRSGQKRQLAGPDWSRCCNVGFNDCDPAV